MAATGGSRCCVYALAKVFELADAQVLALGNLTSGHTLKHVMAALAGGMLGRMLALRQVAVGGR